MTYRPDQIALWPRLIHAATVIDSDLTAALKELAARGASVERTKTGALKFARGAMAGGDYEAFKKANLAPRMSALETVQSMLSATEHPWEADVRKAADALTKRCDNATMALVNAAKAQDWTLTSNLKPFAVDLYLQCELIARVLWDAGCTDYETIVDMCRGELASLKIVGTAGRYWPILTPDGWVWVVEGAGVRPGRVSFGKGEGTKVFAEGELVITAQDLAEALAPIDVGQAMREVC